MSLHPRNQAALRWPVPEGHHSKDILLSLQTWRIINGTVGLAAGSLRPPRWRNGNNLPVGAVAVGFRDQHSCLTMGDQDFKTCSGNFR